MAKKKKEEQRFFGQMPIPNSRKRYKAVKKAWNGLNRRITTDSGGLSDMAGMSTIEYPYLVPAKVLSEHNRIMWNCNEREAVGIFSFDDFLLVIYKEVDKIKIDYINETGDIYTGTLKEDTDNVDELKVADDNRQRCVVQFNVLDDILNPVGSGITRKLIILPDKKVIDYENDADFIPMSLEVETKEFTYPTVEQIDEKLKVDGIEDEEDAISAIIAETSVCDYLKNELKASRRYVYRNTRDGNCYEWIRDTEAEIAQWQYCVSPVFPDLDYATVSHGRLFGVGRGRIYASGYNDYANWTFDSVDEYNESNAWCSSAQANTKYDGEFTGITSYQGHVIAFKRDIAHEIYNTKNPFRVLDLYGDGTIDNRTIQEVNGLLLFVSKGAVHVYNTSTLKDVGYNLGIDVYMEEREKDDVIVSGTDGRNYYLWISRWDSQAKGDREIIYVYDTFCGQWSVLLDNRENTIKAHPVGIAANKNGVFFLRSVYDDIDADYGHVMTLIDVRDTDDWHFETDLMTNEEYDIKHLKKVQVRTRIDEGAGYTIKVILSDETEQEVFSSGGKDGDVVARFILRKTAAYGVKLKFEGQGFVRFYNMELIYEDGGEVNVTI